MVTPLAGVWIEIGVPINQENYNLVTPLAGVWIEIYDVQSSYPYVMVTPLAGVWIEILTSPLESSTGRSSLPLRECGLKYIPRDNNALPQ